ncbi:MAG: AAA family ATPase, partial [Chloroflexi bacterium CG_4_10_14_0_8_um_filter_57_5]
MTQLKITDDLDALLNVLPEAIVAAVHKANNYDDLLEIILDLGRVPTARFVDREVVLSDKEVTRAEIDYVDEHTGEFDADNRAGLERTLHRISAIRNRRGHIVGLTLRVGRAVYGTVDIIQDIVESGKSLLILGRPGV